MEYNFEDVFSFENLYKAYKKCVLGVNWKTSIKNYSKQALENICKTRNALLNGTFKSKGFDKFTIRERGKIRNIHAIHISERVVQRCLCDNWLVPEIHKRLIYDNGATINGKGLKFAVDRITTHLHKYYRKFKNEGYVLLFDFSNYFGTIIHDKLIELINKIDGDCRLKQLYAYFVHCFDGNVGIGLGSQISQISALFYISKLDHLLKEKLHCEFYVRYMDDGIIMSNDKTYLKSVVDFLNSYAIKSGLVLNKNKTHIYKVSNFSFLKRNWHLTKSGKVLIRPSSKNIKRIKRKYHKLVKRNTKIADEYIQSISGYLQQFKKGETKICIN